MRRARSTNRHTFLLFTFNYTIKTLQNAVYQNVAQIMIYPCSDALISAVRQSKIDMVTVLIDAGTNVNDTETEVCYSDQFTALEFAIIAGDIQCIILLLNTGAKFTLGILHHMAAGTHWTVVDGVFSYINAYRHYDSDTAAAFLRAVYSGDIDTVSELLSQGNVIHWDIIRFITRRECSREISSLILNYINNQRNRPFL